jgi:SAM-dependent methyltransferase
MPDYVFAADAAGAERYRLGVLQDLFDPQTFAALDEIGVHLGQTCLEVGPGAGSVLFWLARQVGPTGKVVAADIDPRHLAAVSEPNIEIRQADVIADDLGENGFDLAHARFVLMHLPGRERAMRNLVRAVRPGGWVVTEDTNFEVCLSDDPAADRVFRAVPAMYVALGADGSFGRRAAALMGAVGLVDVRTRTNTAVARGGSRRATLIRLSMARTRDRLIATGIASAADLDHLDRALTDPGFWWHDYTVTSTWGRKP